MCHSKESTLEPSLSVAKCGLPQIHSDLPVISGIKGPGRTYKTMNTSFLGQYLAL